MAEERPNAFVNVELEGGAIAQVESGLESLPENAPHLSIFKFGDASDAYANHKQLYLSFYHLASERQVNFKAFITNLNQNFSADWNYEQVFGRNDPIATFKSTTRKMNVSFEIPAASGREAELNLLKCNALSKFMYPAYEKSGRANTISKPPLMRVAFANLVRDASKGSESSPSAAESGLLVTVSTLNVTPSFGDEGFFDDKAGALFPKLITIDMDFTVIHEHDVGWDAAGPYGDDVPENPFGFNKEENEAFPFGVGDFGNILTRNLTAGQRAELERRGEETQADIEEAQAENSSLSGLGALEHGGGLDTGNGTTYGHGGLSVESVGDVSVYRGVGLRGGVWR